MKDLIRMNQLAGIITEGQARKMMEVLNEGTGTYTSKEILFPSSKKAPKPEEFKVDMMVTSNRYYVSQEELNQGMGRITAVSPNKITYKKGDGKLYNTDPADLIIVGGVS